MAWDTFLTAKWEWLVMINYEVDPAILTPHIPPYTEIDYFDGKAIVSVVGFLFNDTRVRGIKWPGHVNFEEVNLRYYVKHQEGETYKRGVGFISEIVPRPMIAKMANLLYNEHYSTAKMEHQIKQTGDNLLVNYKWKQQNQPWNTIEVNAGTMLEDIVEGSETAFIFEHYFGYSRYNNETTIEYAVKHPRWQVFPVKDYLLNCNVEQQYGIDFVPFITGKKPLSVFLARGSEVSIKRPVKLTKPKNGNSN